MRSELERGALVENDCRDRRLDDQRALRALPDTKRVDGLDRNLGGPERREVRPTSHRVIPSGRLRPSTPELSPTESATNVRPPGDDLDSRGRVSHGEELLVGGRGSPLAGLRHGRVCRVCRHGAAPRSPTPGADTSPRRRNAPRPSRPAAAARKASAWERRPCEDRRSPARSRTPRLTSPRFSRTSCCRSPMRAPVAESAAATSGMHNRSNAEPSGDRNRVETRAATSTDHDRRGSGSMPCVSVIPSIAVTIRSVASASTAEADFLDVESERHADVAFERSVVPGSTSRPASRRRGRSRGRCSRGRDTRRSRSRCAASPAVARRPRHRRRRSAGRRAAGRPSSTHAIDAATGADRADVDRWEAGHVAVGRRRRSSSRASRGCGRA